MSDDDKKEKLEKVAQYLDGDKEKLERIVEYIEKKRGKKKGMRLAEKFVPLSCFLSLEASYTHVECLWILNPRQILPRKSSSSEKILHLEPNGGLSVTPLSPKLNDQC